VEVVPQADVRLLAAKVTALALQMVAAN